MRVDVTLRNVANDNWATEEALLFFFMLTHIQLSCNRIELESSGYLHPAYKMRPAMRSITRKPAIKMQPQRWLSPSFFLVNRMSESDDIIDSDLWWDWSKPPGKSWLHSLCLRSVLVLLCLWTAWWWWCRWKFGWFNCWLLRIWSFKSLSFSLLSMRLSLIEIGDEEVVVAVERDADEADESFLLGFFSFCRINLKIIVYAFFCWTSWGK